MANKTSSASHNFPIISETPEQHHGQPSSPQNETLIGSVIDFNLNTPLILIASPSQNAMPIFNHPPTTILISQYTNGLNDKVVPSPSANVIGRPKGSKNRPKSPMFIPQLQIEYSTKYYVLQVPRESDIVEFVRTFERAPNFKVIILAGKGQVQDVFLRNHSLCEPMIYYDGIFNLLMINNHHQESDVLTNKSETSERSYTCYNGSCNNFMPISMGYGGIAHAGVVVGKLMSVSKVLITVSNGSSIGGSGSGRGSSSKSHGYM